MSDVHFPRHPPSDGAHRLGWWMATRGDPLAADALARAGGVSIATVERLFSGEVEPDDALAAAIARETEGEVLPEDWTRGGSRGWKQRPSPREER